MGNVKRVLILDHFDSFTFNLYHLVASMGHEPRVVRYDELKNFKQFNGNTHLILSPGPGCPGQYPRSKEIVHEAAKRGIPTLGVCLGHQIIGEAYGCEVSRCHEICHGRPSKIYHDNSALFQGLPQGFLAGRYHSLKVTIAGNEILASAWSDTKVLMGLRHRVYPLMGIQFHPESVLTPMGAHILGNFLNI